jgi:(1->4)-alpha-D-glucan 1-alpha-D-glucosylmutase
MNVPVLSTYRVQLQENLKFQDVEKLLPYLEQLGITHLYLSPIFQAKKGSLHGYDTIDPTKISDERGGEEGFIRLCGSIQSKYPKMGIILDIVPNHLGAGWENPYWRDLLEKGIESQYAPLFDLFFDSNTPFKLILPALGASFSECLKRHKISIEFSEEWNLSFKYYDESYPLEIRSYSEILETLSRSLNPSSTRSELILLAERARSIFEKNQANPKEFELLKSDLQKFIRENFSLSAELSQALTSLKSEYLERIHSYQHYALHYWREGVKKLNYRRFFDINNLPAIRSEDPDTFEWFHSKLKKLCTTYPCIQGLRVDHIDGISNPRAYLKKLRNIHQNIWVEKVLSENELLPSSWATLGNTGYDFLNFENEVFVDRAGVSILRQEFLELRPHWSNFESCLNDSKRQMLLELFPAELDRLTGEFIRISKKEFTHQDTLNALVLLITHLPAYRTYLEDEGAPSRQDRTLLNEAFRKSIPKANSKAKRVLLWAKRKFLNPESYQNEDFIRWTAKWQQLTGPVTAKGFEDTAIYRIYPLASLSTVGTPGTTSVEPNPIEHYHEFQIERKRRHPHSFNTTSTHDTKRSEDVRYRINAISEFPHEWLQHFKRWKKKNLHLKNVFKKEEQPSRAFEWFIYQTLLGAWEITKTEPSATFIIRMKNYFVKAAREEKIHTNWNEPNIHYETSIVNFLEGILNTKESFEFLQEIQEFSVQLAQAGAIYSLSALALKVFSPGVSDFYQGNETWDLSLVDPDNRRSVPFNELADRLKAMSNGSEKITPVMTDRFSKQWRNGDIKLWSTHQIIQEKRKSPKLFQEGSYFALDIQGAKRSHALGFLRKHHSSAAFVLVPRRIARALEKLKKSSDESLKIPIEFWQDTQLSLPEDLQNRKWRNVITHEILEIKHSILVRDLLRNFPIAAFILKE